jgi:ribosomal-protein-alanine N-acetyltransferase
MSIRDRFIRKLDTAHDTGSFAHPVLAITPMQRKHIRDIMPIEEAVYPKPWSQKVFSDEIEMMHKGYRYYVVGYVGRELVGYCGLLFADSDAHVTNIAVHPEWQKRGIATELMLELAWHARSRKCEALTLEVRHTNTAAQELYRRFGFVPAGVRRKYYENTDDAIVMWCQDIQQDAFDQRLRDIEKTRQ